MKKYMIISIIVIALVQIGFSCSYKVVGHSSALKRTHALSQSIFFRILSVDSSKELYVIRSVRNDSLFTIISPIESVEGCSRIYVHGMYKLHIHSVFSKSLVGDVDLSRRTSPSIKDFKFYDKIFHLEPGEDLYGAYNLRGLCVID